MKKTLFVFALFHLLHNVSSQKSNATFPIELQWDGKTLPKPSILLDYGTDVSGLVSWDIQNVDLSNPAVFSVAYSESSLYSQFGDWSGGPSVLCRTDSWDRLIQNTLNGSGVLTEDQFQGGFRYQRITIEQKGKFAIWKVSVQQDHFTGDSIGYFKSNSAIYNEMWNVGVKTVKMNMLPVGIIPDQFISTSSGFHVKPNRLGVLTRGCNFKDYSFSIQVQIIKGGFSFAVGSDGNSGQLSMEINVAGQNVQDSVTFTQAIQFGTYQTTFFPSKLPQDRFIDVSAKIEGRILKLYVDKNPVVMFSLDLYKNGPAPFFGAPGIFSTKTQEFVVKNAIVTSKNVTLYKNALTSRDSLRDWAAHSNELPMVIDGSKRDRMIWISDLLVAGPTLYYSVYKPEYIRETLRLLTSYSKTNGLAGTSLTPLWTLQDSPSDGFPPLSFYSYSYGISILEVARDYLMFTGDLAFIKSQWSSWKKMIDYFYTLTDSRGFIVTPDYGLTSDWSWWLRFGNTNYTKLQIQWSVALDCASTFTGLFGDAASAARYKKESERVRLTVNNFLFNATAGLFRVSDVWPHLTAQDVNSFAILHNKLPKEQSDKMLYILEKSLKRDRGYMAFANDTQMDPYSNVFSPYVSYFHASAAFETNQTEMAFRILQSTWVQMADPTHRDYTGTCWEQHPIIGEWQNFISHSHAWSSGSTALISKYVMGVWPTSPGFATYSLKPNLGQLSQVQGAVPTPKGPIQIAWTLKKNVFKIQVTAPKGLDGVLVMPIAGHCAMIKGGNTIKPNSVHEKAVVNLNGGGSFVVRSSEDFCDKN